MKKKKKILQIGATGAEFVADMLRYNNTISILDLRANGLRDEVCSGCLSFIQPFILLTICCSILCASIICRVRSAWLKASKWSMKL